MSQVTDSSSSFVTSQHRSGAKRRCSWGGDAMKRGPKMVELRQFRIRGNAPKTLTKTGGLTFGFLTNFIQDKFPYNSSTEVRQVMIEILKEGTRTKCVSNRAGFWKLKLPKLLAHQRQSRQSRAFPKDYLAVVNNKALLMAVLHECLARLSKIPKIPIVLPVIDPEKKKMVVSKYVSFIERFKRKK